MAKKKKIDFGFTPSKYQQDFFDWIQHGVGNAVIVARAGSAKTTSAVAAMKLIPKKQKCLFIAFNKSIATELQNRLSDYDNVQAKTMHSLGFAICRRNLGNELELDEYKYRTYLKNHITELSGLCGVTMSRSEVEQYIDSIIKLIDFSRFYVAQTVEEVEKVAKKYDIPVAFDECDVVLKCLEWGKDNTKTIDYVDMVWLPVILDLKPIGLQFDWIFLDEAQDTSICVVKLFQKCFKRGSRFVAVLDDFQTINIFAGSSEESVDYLKSLPHTRTMPLPISYRCAKSIIKAANDIVPDIEAREDAPEGEVLTNCHISDIKDGDMVLARSKSPLIRLYTKLLKKNINCYIKGQDIGINLINLLDEIKQEELNPMLDDDGVFVRLYEKMFNERNKLMERHGLDYEDATLSTPIMERYDTIDTLQTLSVGCKTKKEIIDKIRSIFVEDAKGVCLSTIHKAKGLESENVYILCHSQMPSKLATKEWEKLQERNLMYVAYTRAKNRLGFVSEKELPPSGNLKEGSSIMTELTYVENRVCRILGTQPMERMDNAEIARFQLRDMTTVKELGADNHIKKKNVVKARDKRKMDNDLLSELMLLRKNKRP